MEGDTTSTLAAAQAAFFAGVPVAHVEAGLRTRLPAPAVLGGRRLLVTAHRRENWGPGLARIARAVARLVAAHDDLSVLWPLHGNPAVAGAVRAALVGVAPAVQQRLQLVPPLDYPTLLHHLRQATLVLTDSGGLQEEGAALSVPVAVLRASTERPELIDSGGGVLLGTDEDRIVELTSRLLADPVALGRMRDAINPFGDGHAAERIAAVLLGSAAQAAL